MTALNVVAVGRVIDGAGDLGEVERVLAAAARHDLRQREVTIAPAHMGWPAKLPEGVVKGACAPIEVMARLFDNTIADTPDIVIVRGTDNSRSELDKNQRKQLLEVYGPGQTFLTGYTRLAERFVDLTGMTRQTFIQCRDAVFENFWRTWTGLHPHASRPHPRWFEPVSSMFRGVDCANPYVDFSGAIVLASDRAAEMCGVARRDIVRVRSAGVAVCGEDGLASVERIAEYTHLAAVVRDVCAKADVDLRRAIASGQLLLEVYSCFPVVPIAFLLRSGLVTRAEDVPAFLAEHPISVTGGLNLGRAPWNNTTLSALVDVVQRLRSAPPGTIGAVHSVAALGYKQALALLAQ